MIARPGAEAQAAHTDVPPATARAGATLWVALQAARSEYSHSKHAMRIPSV
jgi:hypothetical protein